MSAREAILGRLRAAPQGALPAAPAVADWYARTRRREDPAQQLARLQAALEASHAEVHHVTPANWTAVLLAIAERKGVRSLLVGDGTAHGTQLQTQAQAQGASALRIVCYAQAIESCKEQLFDRIDAGLTRACGAVAETGSLILWPDAHEPRLLSLVPPIHFCLLDSDTLHADLHSAIEAQRWAQGMPANALLVSGPSKTADIQQTLAYGAHGPRELVLLLRSADRSTV